MKKVIRYSVLAAILIAMAGFNSCNKNDDDGFKKRKLSTEELKLVGTWGVYWNGGVAYRFFDDGTYILYYHFTSSPDARAKGYWSLSDGLLKYKAQWSTQTNTNTAGYFEEFGYQWTPWGGWEEGENNIRFGIQDGNSSYAGREYFDILWSNGSFDISTDRYIKDNVGGSVKGM